MLVGNNLTPAERFPVAPGMHSIEKSFSFEHQIAFARFSGDSNPLHVDPVVARRLMAGKPVVHGMHSLLAAMEWHASIGGGVPGQVACEFVQPVTIDQPVTLTRTNTGTEGVSITATAGGQPCAHVDLAPRGSPAVPPEILVDVPDYGALSRPIERSPQAWIGQAGTIGVADGAVARARELFPQASALLGEGAAVGFGALSYLVGMVCPGLHSVFASCRVQLRHQTRGAAALHFRVARFDARVGLFTIEVDGPLQGEVRAFQRPQPQRQLSTADLLSKVKAGEFAGMRSLVIGGSRGLGELTAKLIAAGGGDVVITYAQGESDALDVVRDIEQVGRGRCSSLQHVIGTTPLEALGSALPLDAVFYFATPRIVSRPRARFDPELFERYVAVYAAAFEPLCRLLAAHPPATGTRIFCPSSVYVEERPRGLTEYAMAKAAAELLVLDLQRSLKGLRFVCPRLPRLLTDQTSSIQQSRPDANVEIMLPLIRETMRRSA